MSNDSRRAGPSSSLIPAPPRTREALVPITIHHDLHGPDGAMFTAATTHDTATRVERNQDGDVLLYDDEDRMVGVYAPHRFAGAAIDHDDEDNGTAERPGSPGQIFISGKFDPGAAARDLGRRLAALKQQSRDTERDVANRIAATPGPFGTYSGPELVRAYERGRGDMADDLGAEGYTDDIDPPAGDCCGGGCHA